MTQDELLSPETVSLLVLKSKGGNGPVIKELIRHCAQFLIESGKPDLTVAHVEAALVPLYTSLPMPLCPCTSLTR
jgi:hypothetical protein